MGDLVRSTLRMYPTRVVVGECRGEEVIDLMRVLNSGHCGGMSTLHASGVSRVPGRLISLGLLAHVEPNTMAGLADGAFDVVLHMERRPGKRYLAQIGMLCMVEGRLVGRTVCSWDGRGEPVAGEAWRPSASCSRRSSHRCRPVPRWSPRSNAHLTRCSRSAGAEVLVRATCATPLRPATGMPSVCMPYAMARATWM